jgi:hypothetical protein
MGNRTANMAGRVSQRMMWTDDRQQRLQGLFFRALPAALSKLPKSRAGSFDRLTFRITTNPWFDSVHLKDVLRDT